MESYEHREGSGNVLHGLYGVTVSRDAGAMQDEGARSRRLLTILRFLTYLSDSEREEELLRTVIQAAAVWYDVEAFAYRRDAVGRFVLDTWLPGADLANRPRELPASVVSSVGDVPRLLSSAVEFEELGWRDATGETLLLSITYSGRPQWIIAVGGGFDDEGVTTFAAVGLALGAVLQRRVDRQAGEICEQIRQLLRATNSFEDTLLVDVLVKGVSAQAGQLLVQSAQSVPAVDPTHTDDARDSVTASALPAADRIRFSVPLAEGRALMVVLDGTPGAPFRPGTFAVVEAAAAVIQRWFDTAVEHREDAEETITSAGFETRVDEEVTRARRFGLEFGLAVITMPTPTAEAPPAAGVLMETIRGELRRTDLIGKLGTGEIAVLLVHTGAEGTTAAGERLKGRLQALVNSRQLPLITIGQGALTASSESASALLSEARAQQTVVVNTRGTAG